ncbi:MAG TPA: ABC transporter permease [Methylophilaceae bacterium]|jgi:phospholipid/cholesterol/gamma-HCH transport system permease protein
MSDAVFKVEEGSRVVLAGQWSLRAAENHFAALQQQLAPYFSQPQIAWDLTSVEQLDSAGAALLLTGWGGQRSSNVSLRPEHAALFDSLQQAHPSHHTIDEAPIEDPSAKMGLLQSFVLHLADFIALTGLIFLEFLYLFRRPQDIPWKEISANIYKGGVMALPVMGLVGGMIGVAMSYLMALQLRKFGADIFIVNILGLAIIRELGPILMSVLIAGRSGSAMTAQIGVMRVTEEIDALATMGVSRTLRLILPKVVALTLVAPLLLFWTSLWALIGGMTVAFFQLGIGFEFFIEHLPRVVKATNLALATVKGFTFGLTVALIACHFGLRVQPNTESLSNSTTSSVVTSITVVILLDALFAIATRSIGI